jgi:dipeptidyl-peptidase-4
VGAEITLTHRILTAITACAVALATTTLTGQLAPSLDDALRAIFEREEFKPQSLDQAAWIDGGRRYTALRAGAGDLVAYDTATGVEQVLVPASALVPPGAKARMDIDEYAWSTDKSKLLLFTNRTSTFLRAVAREGWRGPGQPWRTP